MGLSERKVKQRIGHDPRNLTWSNDANRFSYKHMTSLGWTDKSGIGGSDLTGNPNHIAVARKLDNGGIGVGRARKEGEELSSGAGQAGRGLEDVLRRLAQASASPSPSQEGQAVVNGESPAPEAKAESSTPVPNRMASRRKHLHSKRLASSSPAALAEILGVPLSSLPSTPTPLSPAASSPASANTPEPPITPNLDGSPQRDSEEVISTSTVSVADYFRQKLREKMLARQAASSGADVKPDLSARTQALLDAPKVEVGGVEFEGSRLRFEEKEEVELVDLGGEEAPVESVIETKKGKKGKGKEKEKEKDVKPSTEALMATSADDTDEKARKRARKDAKKLAKAEKETRVLPRKPPVDTDVKPIIGDESTKSKRKRDTEGESAEDRKARKEKKRAKDDRAAKVKNEVKVEPA